jgi:hypothetical protein
MVETLRARNQLAQSEQVRGWMRANGVDLWKEGSGRGLDQLDGVQMLMAEKTGSQADLRAFDTLTTNQVAEAVGAVDEVLKDWESHSGGNPRRFTLTADHVHAVKTREGGVALVEILEENPRSGRTRLRYKLVQRAPALSQDAAIRAILDYGGFVKTNAEGRGFRISLVYDEDAQGNNRRECAGTSDEIARWLPAFPELEELWLVGSQASDEAMDYVGRLRRLKELMMWNAHVSDEGVAKLNDLKELRHVHINHARIGDASLSVLATLPNLEGMSLQGNDFTDQGLAALKEMTQLRVLWIGLGTERFTDAGLASLSGLVNLEELELGSAPISDKGLKQLHRLSKLRLLIRRGETLEGGRAWQAVRTHETQAAAEPASLTFGPLREVTLHNCDVQPEALDFETGRILAVPEGTEQQLRAGNLDWSTPHYP